MLLSQLLTGLPCTRTTTGDAPISSVVYDSRRVTPGALFVAYRGFHSDGHRYITQAVARGATAVIYEDASYDGQIAAPAARVPNARVALAPLAARLLGYPGHQLRVVGITGTDGKTTTTALTAAALDAAGRSSGFATTVDFKVGPRRWSNDTRQSTPEAPEVQALLADMRAAGCSHAVLEATSHALAASWGRLVGCGFDVAVLTNVTHEHLDFHGSVAQYRRDKAELFALLGETRSGAIKQRKLAIVNADDPHHQQFLAAAPAYAERLTYAIHAPADVRAAEIIEDARGLRFVAHTPWGTQALQLRLAGSFNVSNALAALTVACAEGVPLAAACAALAAVPGVAGRMQRIDAGQPFAVIVDYAHTPESFAKVFGVMRAATAGRMIAVFGSAGERDRAKRALQGATAARHCALVIITDEDPRHEDRHAIIAQVAAGAAAASAAAGGTCTVEQIPDRVAAIRAALAAARPGDTVLLLGKGHEGCIIYGDTRVPWDEAAAARAALADLGYTTVAT